MNPKKKKTGKSGKLKELALERVVSVDMRDPRARGEGPYGGKHPSHIKEKNQWAQWRICSRCALRLSYVPYKDSPSSSLTMPTAENVQTALKCMKKMDKWETIDYREVRAIIKIVEQTKILHGPGDIDKMNILNLMFK